MKLKSLLFTAFFATGAVSAFGQKTTHGESSKAFFVEAKAELEKMLDGKKSLSYERAIFTIENAYWQGTISDSLFDAVIIKHTKNIRKIIADQKPMPEYNPTDLVELAQMSANERKDNYMNALINGAIFRYITDTTYFIDKDKFSYHLPYGYSFADPMGSTDWANTHVTHLLDSKNGNCFALASLYKIFAERLNAKANLCTAPGHIYIRHADDKGTLYNVELSNGGSFPGTGTIETLTYSTTEAVKNNVALRDLDLKHSVALCLVYLAKGYQHKTGSKPDNFMLDCAEAALKYDPLCLNAMLLKSAVLENRLTVSTEAPAQMQNDDAFHDYEAWITKLFTLGYREMPHEMRNLLMKGWTKDSLTVVFSKRHGPQDNSKSGIQDTRYASLSWGIFDEEMRTKPVEQFGTALYDTRTRKIIGFKPVQALYNDYDFDPVAFAWNVDPLAHKFPGQSPYSAMNNNPTLNVDPDGQAGIIYLIPLANSGMSGKELLSIVNSANVALESMKLTTRVQIFSGNPADFKTYNLDPTDAVAVLGQKTDVVNYIAGFRPGLARNMQDQLGGDSPENSEQGGFVIGLDTKTVRSWGKEMNSDFSTAAAFTILHGAGHNADDKMNHVEVLRASLRWSGGHVGSAITGAFSLGEGNTVGGWGKEEGVNSLGDLMNNKPLRGSNRNSMFIEQMQKRFGTGEAKDNYSRNAGGWQYLKKIFKSEPIQGTRLQ